MSKKQKKHVKVESVEEFLSRGGEIKKIAPVEMVVDLNGAQIGSSNSPTTMMSLSEGSLFFSENKPKVPRKKPVDLINFSAPGFPVHLLKFRIN